MPSHGQPPAPMEMVAMNANTLPEQKDAGVGPEGAFLRVALTTYGFDSDEVYHTYGRLACGLDTRMPGQSGLEFHADFAGVSSCSPVYLHHELRQLCLRTEVCAKAHTEGMTRARETCVAS